ncbi:MAG: hypothetical protein FWE86_01240, partial [Oscillospiraceae bacterium]|nr:hypothetical protein [Oscillospiraceae bacterium]
MQKNNKRGLSILLALLTVLAVFAAMPVTALAVSGDDPNTCEILNSSGGSQGTYSFAGAYNVWSNGRTLKLLDNIETGQQLNLANTNHSIVLDLNGKTLTVTRAAVPLRIDNGSTLTVKGPGTLKVISTAENSVAVRVNNGTLAVTGGAVINADGTAGGNGISVYGGSKATVTTAAAGLTGTGAYSGVYVTGAGSEITVTGDVGGDGYGVYAADGAKVTINGAITSPYYIGLYIGSNRVSKNAGDYEATTTKPGYYTYTDGVNSVWVKNLPPVKPTIVRAAGDDRIKTTI